MGAPTPAARIPTQATAFAIAWEESPAGATRELLLVPRCDSELRVARHLSALPLIEQCDSRVLELGGR
jgi:hypothetical protein